MSGTVDLIRMTFYECSEDIYSACMLVGFSISQYIDAKRNVSLYAVKNCLLNNDFKQRTLTHLDPITLPTGPNKEVTAPGMTDRRHFPCDRVSDAFLSPSYFFTRAPSSNLALQL